MNPIPSKFGAPALPQINLVPKEIAERRSMRAVQTLAVLVVLAVIVLVAIVGFFAWSLRAVAENSLDDALAEEATAVAQRDAKQPVFDAFVAQEAEEFTLTQIGWTEIDTASLYSAVLATANENTGFDVVQVSPPSSFELGGQTGDALLGGGIGSVDFVAFTSTYEEAIALVDRIDAIPGLGKATASLQEYDSEPPNISWKVQGSAQITARLLNFGLVPEEGVTDPRVFIEVVAPGVTDGFFGDDAEGDEATGDEPADESGDDADTNDEEA